MKNKITTAQYINIAKVAGVGLGAFLLFKKGGIINSIVNTFKGKTSVEVAEETKKELAKLDREGTRKSYGASQYTMWADQIYAAIITSNPFNPTDEDSIYRIFGLMKNLADVVTLIQAFGVRRIEYSTRGGGLGVQLQGDLTDSEILKLNKILSDKNINYKF
jgi:3-oxoacyl-ACP reductase-like protein